MKKETLIEIALSICVCYTILSVTNAVIVISNPRYNISAENSVMMLLWCSIGTLVLFSHRFLQRFSPLMMVTIQYLIALILIVATIYATGVFEPLHPDAYIDGIRSFTIPFIIGGIVYYGALYLEAKQQNKLIQELRIANSKEN